MDRGFPNQLYGATLKYLEGFGGDMQIVVCWTQIDKMKIIVVGCKLCSSWEKSQVSRNKYDTMFGLLMTIYFLDSTHVS